MRILFLAPRFPYPPTRGDCIRAWGELEYLSRRHEIWLACLDQRRPADADLDHVRRRCAAVEVTVRSRASAWWRGGRHFLRGGSLVDGFFRDPALLARVERWAQAVRFDAVLIFAPEMAQYAACVPGARRVLDMNDVESFKFQCYARRARPPLGWLYECEAGRLMAAERRWAATHDVCLLVNERERRKLDAAARPRASAVVRTGVDLSRYAPVASAALPRAPVVGFVGSMFYPPNVQAVEWFGRNVWPRVKRALPAARWLIVGNRPVRSVRRWGRMPGVTVTGFVEDVGAYLAQMRVFACAVHEEIGVQTKLIEALAAGRPAVVTPAVAAGIDYAGAPPFLIADSSGDFAEAVIRLLADEALASALSQQARAVAERNYRAEDQYALVERWLAGSATWGDEPGRTHAASRQHRPEAAVAS